jgi:hypothetical protein
MICSVEAIIHPSAPDSASNFIGMKKLSSIKKVVLEVLGSLNTLLYTVPP